VSFPAESNPPPMPLPVFVGFSVPLAVLDATSAGEVRDGFIGDPSAAAPPLLIAATSGPASGVNRGAAAMAWITTRNGTSGPFFGTALSNTMASAEPASPFARADACVTCPTSLVFLGITVWPFALTASVTCAFTASPVLTFFESTGVSSSTGSAVPRTRETLSSLPCAKSLPGNSALAPRGVDPPPPPRSVPRKIAKLARFISLSSYRLLYNPQRLRHFRQDVRRS